MSLSGSIPLEKLFSHPTKAPFRSSAAQERLAITRKGQTENISIDRVKPAYIMDQYGPLSTSKNKKVSFIFPK
ncbi:Uncharacterized protein FKW44_000140 [Caligus rogercresseyi]|uniref:Uncharacterized protein n=1 Tax=Caligus rogercresseyi TaxID=217165 RepID=A0A7T8KH50_CALRO|nr:Uncharacterized protein FKW44_000133 [Caligus rogercresseyi]QQP55709.1 Uncharacterized protein FKW44_000140 [Caligus rogercresseyi]